MFTAFVVLVLAVLHLWCAFDNKLLAELRLHFLRSLPLANLNAGYSRGEFRTKEHRGVGVGQKNKLGDI